MQTGSRQPWSARFLIALILVFPLTAHAADLIVRLPRGEKAKSAIATPATQPAVNGAIQSSTITFTSLAAGKPYDLTLTLDDGIILRGVNMGWYTAEPAAPGAAPLDEEGRRQIAALVGDVKSFYNVSRIIALAGDENRATVLVERIRSTSFDSGKSGEVIWRVELWYFVNDFGGWNEIPQTDKVLERVRFASPAEYRAAVQPLRWAPLLGGITLANGEKREVTVPAEPGGAATTQTP